MAGKTAKPLIEIRGDERPAIQSLKRLVNEYGRAATSINQSMELVRNAAALVDGSIGRVVRGVVAATQAAIKYERALAEVQTISDRAAFSTGKINEITSELARSFGTDVTEGARALYQTISSGVTDAAEASRTLAAANQLAIGGVTDLTTSVDGLTSVMNAYATSNVSAREVADKFFVAIRDGKTTAGELASSIGQVASISASSGVALDDLLASIATITTSGVATAEAVTQVRSALIAVQKVSPETQKKAKALGVDFSLAAVRAKGLGRFLRELVNESGLTREELVSLFGRVEGLNAAIAIASNEGEKYSQIMRDMGVSTGAADEATKRMQETFRFQLDRLKAVADATQTTFGTMVTESAAARDSVSSLTQIVQGLHQQLILWDQLEDGAIWRFFFGRSNRGPDLGTGPGFWERFGEALSGSSHSPGAAVAALFRAAFGSGGESTTLTMTNSIAVGEEQLARSVANGEGDLLRVDPLELLAAQGVGRNSVLAPTGGAPGGGNRLAGGGGRGRRRRSRNRTLSTRNIPAAFGGFSISALGEAGELAKTPTSFAGFDLGDFERQQEIADSIARLQESRIEAERKYRTELEKESLRRQSIMATEANRTSTAFNQIGEAIQSSAASILQSGLADTFTSLAQGIGDSFENVLGDFRKIIGGIISNVGIMLIQLGTGGILAGTLGTFIPAFAALTGGPLGVGAGLAAVAGGTVMVGIGKAIGGSGASAGAGSTGTARAPRSGGATTRGADRFSGDSSTQLPTALGASTTVVNVTFSGPVADERRAARRFADLLSKANTLRPNNRRRAFA